MRIRHRSTGMPEPSSAQWLVRTDVLPTAASSYVRPGVRSSGEDLGPGRHRNGAPAASNTPASRSPAQPLATCGRGVGARGRCCPAAGLGVPSRGLLLARGHIVRRCAFQPPRRMRVSINGSSGLCPSLERSTSDPFGCGGTGRRIARFMRRPQRRVGSTPTTRASLQGTGAKRRGSRALRAGAYLVAHG